MIKVRQPPLAATKELNALFASAPGRRWYDCTPGSLVGHISNQHLSPPIMYEYGIPRFDIEVAQYRKINLDRVAERAYLMLEKPDFLIRVELPSWFIKHYPPSEYKADVVKTLLYMEQTGTARIDWNRVTSAFPAAREVRLDIDKDSGDSSFFEALAGEIAEHEKRLWENNAAVAALSRK